ncbi:hypothetical protein LZ016_01505 [Sphingomonas sp. SM33]|uniref:DUF2029 domain-containing protein n=1 Tax=Sphingomonas telluris TaxID=2907998 RepID=A0ABS9VJR4_9SPHN|nr:hypothetical protein [Sphingomonas telluris]MCH8614784.1 hypothetical protein [Sphingomonas telluris]
MLKAKTPPLSSVDDANEASARYDSARLLTLAIIVGLAGIVIGLPYLPRVRAIDGLTLHLTLTQDLPLVPVFLLAAFLRPRAVSISPPEPRGTRVALVATILVFLFAGWFGHSLVFQGYDLSRDEQMAVFDQGIYAHGRALWPFPAEWRSVADALNRRFMLPIGDREFWVSAYLPVHSAFRAVLSEAGIVSLASPLMAALAAASLWSVARRLWPESNRTVVLALLLLGTSSQAVITSMTAFSMSMHLGLNLLWLALFLADRKQTHALALIVGFFAVGIHQPLFHPMFVGPFLLLLIGQRRWSLLTYYIVGYAVIALFWLAWPIWVASHATTARTLIDCGTANCASGVSFSERLINSVKGVGFANIWLTSANLLRFICWQHLLLLPLAFFGAISCWRSEPIVKALTASFLLPIIVLALILPWQGHGWGYRYVHPVLGNAILLACYGFHRMESRGLSLQRPLLVTTALAVVLLPLHAWMASKVVTPFAQISERLAAIPADVVIVDTQIAPFGQDVVFNSFDLSNRPKRLIAKLVKPEALAELCQSKSIAFFDGAEMAPLAHLFHTVAPKAPSPEALALREEAMRLNCRVIP